MRQNASIKLILGVILSFLHTPIISYTQDINTIQKMVDTEFESLRNGSIKVNEYKVSPNDELTFIKYIKKLETDKSSSVKNRVLNLMYSIGVKSKDPIVRQTVAEFIVNGFSNSEPLYNQTCFKCATTFNFSDFSNTTQKKIEAGFDFYSTLNTNNNNYLLLLGIINSKTTIPKLQKLARSFNKNIPDFYSGVSWYAKLALARIQTPANIDDIITAIELENNIITRVSKLLNLVAYTKHNDALRLLKKYINSNERLPSIVEDSPGILASQYAFNLVIKYYSFPGTSIESLNHSAKELDECNKYIDEYLSQKK